MTYRNTFIFLFALAASVFAEESLPEIQFVPMNSLTESVANEQAKQKAKPLDYSVTSSQATSAAPTETPYGLPAEIMPLWDSLTIKQKAAQMVMVYMTPAEFMLRNEFGGYLVMKNHLKNLDKFTE